jgi:predicted amidophosphoribosyltransferase
MTKHRHPQDSVSNDVHPDNPEPFNPAEALQSLHLEVVQLEALANAANEAVVQLPFPPGRDARRPFDRVYALVSKVADETNAVVNHGDQLIAQLSAHLQRKEAGA